MPKKKIPLISAVQNAEQYKYSYRIYNQNFGFALYELKNRETGWNTEAPNEGISITDQLNKLTSFICSPCARAILMPAAYIALRQLIENLNRFLVTWVNYNPKFSNCLEQLREAIRNKREIIKEIGAGLDGWESSDFCQVIKIMFDAIEMRYPDYERQILNGSSY